MEILAIAYLVIAAWFAGWTFDTAQWAYRQGMEGRWYPVWCPLALGISWPVFFIFVARKRLSPTPPKGPA